MLNFYVAKQFQKSSHLLLIAVSEKLALKSSIDLSKL